MVIIIIIIIIIIIDIITYMYMYFILLWKPGRKQRKFWLFLTVEYWFNLNSD